METKRSKSKRSLRGEDVYEMACKYDVGLKKNQNGGAGDLPSSKNKKRKKEGENEHSKRVKGPLDVDTSQDKNLHPLNKKWRYSKEELANLKSRGIKVKFGKWSKKETKILERNMKEYLSVNNIEDPAPLIFGSNGKRKKQTKATTVTTNFYRCLAEGINRPLFRVYAKVFEMYDPGRHAGKWSTGDSEALLRLHAQYGPQWKEIGSRIGRSANSAYHRFNEMHTSKGYWSDEEVARLNGAVRASTGTEFGSQIYGEINWNEVSDFVMTRSARQCRAKWMNKVCWTTADGSMNSKWNSEDDVKLIERIYEGMETDENDINWLLLTKEFPNSPSVNWLRLRWNNLKKAVPNYTECEFEELLDYLYDKHRPFLKKTTEEKEVIIIS